MLNLTVLTGRLVNDPELRQTQSNIPVASFRVAVRRDFVKKGDGDTDFFDVVAWRGTAEFVNKYFKKGSMIQLVGRLQNRHWKDKHDQARVSTELVADKAYFGESKGKDDDNGGPPDAIDPFGGNDFSSDAPAGFDPFA